MAYEIPLQKLSFEAGEDLSSNQFQFVTMESDGKVDLADAETDIVLGVLQNKPEAGQSATVMISGVTKVEADETLAAGDLVHASADGQAAVFAAGTDTTKYSAGLVLEGAAAGELATILLGNYGRGA
jgi:hypothetical protein